MKGGGGDSSPSKQSSNAPYIIKKIQPKSKETMSSQNALNLLIKNMNTQRSPVTKNTQANYSKFTKASTVRASGVKNNKVDQQTDAYYREWSNNGDG